MSPSIPAAVHRSCRDFRTSRTNRRSRPWSIIPARGHSAWDWRPCARPAPEPAAATTARPWRDFHSIFQRSRLRHRHALSFQSFPLNIFCYAAYRRQGRRGSAANGTGCPPETGDEYALHGHLRSDGIPPQCQPMAWSLRPLHGILSDVQHGAKPCVAMDGGLGRGDGTQLSADDSQARLGYSYLYPRGRARSSGEYRNGGLAAFWRFDPFQRLRTRGTGAQGAARRTDVRPLCDAAALDREVADGQLRGLRHRLA